MKIGKKYYIDDKCLVVARFEGLVNSNPPKYLFSVKIGNRAHNVFKPIREYREYKFYHLIFGIFNFNK